VRILFVLPLILITVLMSASYGATVSLTGSCTYSSPSLQSNSINVTFSLVNTGDYPATSVSVVPKTFGPLSGMKLNSSNIGSLYPNVTKNYTVTINGLSEPGEYIFGIIVSYFQGSSNFFAAFPCGFDYNSRNLTDYVTPISLSYKKDVLHLSLFNIAQNKLNATTYIIAPPQVSYTPDNISASVNPDAETNMSFNVSLSQLSGIANATYGISLASVYNYNGNYYYSLKNYYVSTDSKPASSISGSMLLVIFFVAVIIILVGLITFSVLRKKRKPKTM